MPLALDAAGAARAIAQGELTSETLVRACLERIAKREPTVKAWSWLDPDQAIRSARERDKEQAIGAPLGPLHGVPIGVKDVIDVAGMPTSCNSRIYEGYRPSMDAECVRVVRAAGAVILGKTDTVEFASGGRRALTRNPHNPAHTPGGSSSGSAAAVADGHVPLAFGTQTAGSLIRPASYNGIYALKPTYGAVAWPGARQFAPTLDTIGWYGRSVAALELVARAFRLRELDGVPPPDASQLKVGFCRSPSWPRAQEASRHAFEIAAERLAAAGVSCVTFDLPDVFDALPAAQDTIMIAEGRAHFLGEFLQHQHWLHRDFCDRVENSQGISHVDYLAAVDHAAAARPVFDALLADKLDVVLTPAAMGEAPPGNDAAGAWAMNVLWTLLHVPCLSIPVTTGPAGMPVGIQIVAPRFGEPKLLAAAHALSPILDTATG